MNTQSKLIIPATLLSVLLATPAAASYTPTPPSIEQTLQVQIERQLADSQARQVVEADEYMPTADDVYPGRHVRERIPLPPEVTAGGDHG